MSTDLIYNVKQGFNELQQDYNDFCKDELNPAIGSNSTVSTVITGAAIGAAVAAVIAAGPLGLIAAVPLLLIAAKTATVAARNWKTFRTMFELEWTWTKDTDDLIRLGFDKKTAKKLKVNPKIPNVPLIFLRYINSDINKKFTDVYDKLVEKENLSNDMQKAADAVENPANKAVNWLKNKLS